MSADSGEQLGRDLDFDWRPREDEERPVVKKSCPLSVNLALCLVMKNHPRLIRRMSYMVIKFFVLFFSNF